MKKNRKNHPGKPDKPSKVAVKRNSAKKVTKKPRAPILSGGAGDLVAGNLTQDFPIVGIGASAGGLEALELFFGNMPNENGMAFVVIQHLDPVHVGIMPELLQRITAMQVFQASDQLVVKPNCVYVIPPNKSLSILNGSLHLFDPVATRGLRLPVDFFLRSLAADRQEKSIGIILSGMGSDGSLGLKAIREENGIVLVQTPATAKFDSMPRSACEAVIPDAIAPVEELPAKLIAFTKSIPVITAVPVKTVDDKNSNALDKIFILLREQTGHDFSLYKKNTLLRRVERRKGVHQINRIQNYVRFLQENPKEVDFLFKELLVGVTSFFRDPAAWGKLKKAVLPELLSQAANGSVLRAWVVACSTGEEAYSLAITFKEALEEIKPRKNLRLQIFASDLDPEAINVARKGLFSSKIISDVSPERISRFFTAEDDNFRVNANIREMVVFSCHNVAKDPPFSKLDILTCRNMLIYMEQELQKKIMLLFNYSLNTGGILFLGSAETLENQCVGFAIIDSRLKLFKKNTIPIAQELVNFPRVYQPLKKVWSLGKKSPPPVADNIQSLTDQLLLQITAPASVLTNGSGDILYITGRTGKYLEPAAGKANINIFAMAREGLRLELPGAFYRAKRNFDPVMLHNIKIGTNGGAQLVNIRVQRLENPVQLKDMVLIVFTDVPASIHREILDPKTGKQRSTGKQRQLEIELQRTREDLQNMREEMQMSQEELKSMNEELQSSNEELQSTNEELTTSKEEMQSLNEELQTINIELQSKVTDFERANNDMKNLLNSTEIATLFLDEDLNIRRFTDNVVDVFKLRSTDVGRPFTDLVTDLNYSEISNHALQVIRTLIPTETSIATVDGRWFNVRIMPYRTLDNYIDGLVLTFSNTTVSKNLEIELTNEVAAHKETDEKFRAIFDQSPIAIMFYDADGILVNANHVCIKLLGVVEKNNLMGCRLFDDPNIPDAVRTKLMNKKSVKFESEFSCEKVKRLNLYQTVCSGTKKLDRLITPLITSGRLIGYIEQIQIFTGLKLSEPVDKTKKKRSV